MRIDHLGGYAVLLGKMLELVSNATRTNAFAKTIEEEIA